MHPIIFFLPGSIMKNWSGINRVLFNELSYQTRPCERDCKSEKNNQNVWLTIPCLTLSGCLGELQHNHRKEKHVFRTYSFSAFTRAFRFFKNLNGWRRSWKVDCSNGAWKVYDALQCFTKTSKSRRQKNILSHLLF